MNYRPAARVTVLCVAPMLLLVFISGFSSVAAADFFDGVDQASEPVMAKARERIEQNRKSDMSVRLLDQEGQLISQHARFRLLSHEFRFGSNLFGFENIGQHDRLEPAKRVVDELFNTAIVCDYWFKTQRKKEEKSGCLPVVRIIVDSFDFGRDWSVG